MLPIQDPSQEPPLLLLQHELHEVSFRSIHEAKAVPFLFGCSPPSCKLFSDHVVDGVHGSMISKQMLIRIGMKRSCYFLILS
uniref:Uncharacterized protein n=1 Tax=Lotus japonicus TaxID=34305 RepID=I3SMG9_LOTJA|nr:unknown [Lotus japonicus]